MTARYVFHAPLVWTDELASILFLWLAMLGSVIALQRSEHMRLTAVVAGMSPAGRARTDALASAAVAVFLVMIVPSAWDYASDEWFIETPALGIHNTFRAMAIPVGAVLMVVTALTRLLRLSWRDALFGVAVVLALARGAAFRRAVAEGLRQLEPRAVLRHAARRGVCFSRCPSALPSGWPPWPISRP